MTIENIRINNSKKSIELVYRYSKNKLRKIKIKFDDNTNIMDLLNGRALDFLEEKILEDVLSYSAKIENRIMQD